MTAEHHDTLDEMAKAVQQLEDLMDLAARIGDVTPNIEDYKALSVVLNALASRSSPVPGEGEPVSNPYRLDAARDEATDAILALSPSSPEGGVTTWEVRGYGQVWAKTGVER